MCVCARARVCVCARARACMCVYVCVCVGCVLVCDIYLKVECCSVHPKPHIKRLNCTLDLD